MRVSLLLLCTFFAVTLSAGERKDYRVEKKEFYKSGEGESVRKWKRETYENAKTSGKPFCIYIYDPEDKNATRAKYLEDPFVLGNEKVQSRLENFLTVKLTADANDGKRFEDVNVKGWPAAWLAKAKTGASLILCSSDMRMLQVYDRETSKESITAAGIAAVMDGILKYEGQLKADAEKAAAKAAAKAPKPAEEAAK